VLPIISGKQCIKALREVGYRELRQKGSHVRLACEGRSPVTVPWTKTLDRDTLRSILRAAKLSAKEFSALL